ncbi:MAG: hypothetical protein UT66_C0003G0055 [candidate division CPR2 bacterium GW2011_GWC1_39_9]|uniref:Bacterial Ig-like domain-containing protein n=1 Tax=candidate division CPR2 bacterium GW2011_GWC2_39_10 TaxID=1618345 RepID=A0A0G0LQZ4_UNCC2|nr:MAG: hypothetical protein UT18_C0011G0014 [candidate division CPR2 bacterium GW2011_GWC2_39_10]KKR36111.1 MAG: hypothetical protein UT66_C0003G0055 [candidate division CPR2 bacterium GW2011_GWC1_39_9]
MIKKKIISIIVTFFAMMSLFNFAPVYAANSSLILSPSGTYVVGNTFSVGFGVQSAVSVDTIKLCLNYDASLITLTSSSYIRQPILDLPNGGCIFYAAFNPGFTSGTLATLNFRANSAGSTNISITGSSLAISAGGYTTITNLGSVNITVNNPPVVTVAPSKPYAPAVYSSSHPDETKWYKEKNVKLSWAKAGGVTDFSYSWDSNAGTVPDEATEGSAVTKEYQSVADGTHYFHIKAKNGVGWGTVKHFKVGTDNVNPENLNIIFEAGGNSLEPQNLVKAEATDALSGIDHYAVKVDNGEYIDQAIPYVLPFKDTNSHDISVKAFDKAGNFIESSKKFSAKEVKIPLPVIGSISSNFTVTAGNSTNMTKEYIIKGTGTANTTVKITIDGKEKGEANVNDKGVWSITVKDLGAGEHNLSAKTKFGDKNSEETSKIKFHINEDGSLVLGDKTQKSGFNYIYLYILGGVIVSGAVGFVGYKFWFKKRKVKKNKYTNDNKDDTDISNLGDFLKH